MPLVDPPEEIIEQIYSSHSDDSITLRNGALVARTWRIPCQRLLFMHAFINKLQAFKSLAKVLETTPALRSLVKAITFETQEAPFRVKLPSYGHLFPALRNLTFKNAMPYFEFFMSADPKSICLECDIPVRYTVCVGPTPSHWALESISCTSSMFWLSDVLDWLDKTNTQEANSLISATFQMESNDDIDDFVERYSSLQHLTLYFQPLYKSPVFRAPNLQNLSLPTCDRFDTIFSMLRDSNLPSLKVLEIGFAHHLPWHALSDEKLKLWTVPPSLSKQLEKIVMVFKAEVIARKSRRNKLQKLRSLFGVAGRSDILHIRQRLKNGMEEDILI